MKYLLTFSAVAVFFLALGISFAEGTLHISASKDGSSTTTLFGAKTMQFGINAHTGQQGTQAILAYSYSQGQTFKVGGQSYAVPDQLSATPDSTQKTTACENLETNFSSILKDYKGQYSFANGGGSQNKNAFSGAAQHSEELLKIKGYLDSHSQEDVEYGYSSYTEDIYSLDFGPAFILQPDPSWKKMVEALPKTIASPVDRELYLKFVEKCGTHYVANGVFGGSVHTVTFVNKTIIDRYGGTEVVLQMSNHFQNYLNDITGKNSSSQGRIEQGRGGGRRAVLRFSTRRGQLSSTPSWFNQDTTTYDFIHGGNVTLAKQDGDWLPSVNKAPALVKSSLLSLSALLTFDPTRQATLDSFIKSYINGVLLL